MANLDFLARWAKYVLFAVNVVFVVTGIVILTVGAVVQADYNRNDTILTLLDEPYYAIPILMMTIGSIVLIVAGFGCVGAAKESYCMLLSFTIMMVVIFVLELSASITGFALRDKVGAYLSGKLDSSLVHYGMPDEITVVWDDLQRTYECCGVEGPDDWEKIYNNTALGLFPKPMSCCAIQPGAVGHVTCFSYSKMLFKEGCADKLSEIMYSHTHVIAITAITIAVVQIFEILFAYYLAKKSNAEL